ncbi:MAG TPA: hypothetical protein VJO35_02595 [Terriglobales bacterium]|nr:hypothetical protein [Terriglobales bacterium]
MNNPRAAGLVWTTRIATIIALPCPLADLIHQLILPRIRIPLHTHGSAPEAMLQASSGAPVFYCFLLWRFGKLACGILAILTIAVALQHKIEPRARAVTVAAGSLTCCLLLWWINTTAR